MKKTVAVVGFCFLLVFFYGCELQDTKKTHRPANLPRIWDGNAPSHEAMPDFLESKSQNAVFPESMVGVWKSVIPNIDWTIKFEHDGSIKRITHSLAGPVKIEEGGATGTGPDTGSYYVFLMGPCEAKYMPERQAIRVKIILERYRMKMPAGELEGRVEDYFEGPVSEDGKTWNVKWWSFGWLKDAAVPDINEIKNTPIPLVFTKLGAEDANKY